MSSRTSAPPPRSAPSAEQAPPVTTVQETAPSPERRRRRHLIAKFAGAVALIGGMAGAVDYETTDLPPHTAILDDTSFICDGTVAIDACTPATAFAEIANKGNINHIGLGSLNDVSEVTKNALLAAEDDGFFKRKVACADPLSTARALWNTILGNTQGGSTIAQQYIKNAYLTPQQTFSRKWTEVKMACKLSEAVSREDIFKGYLDIVYFGRGAYGIQAAAQRFFGKSAAELDLKEASLLIGRLPAPDIAQKLDTPQEINHAKTEQLRVLNRMEAEGYLGPTDPEHILTTQKKIDDIMALNPADYTIPPPSAAEVNEPSHIIKPNFKNIGTEYYLDGVRLEAERLTGKSWSELGSGGYRISVGMIPALQGGVAQAQNDVLPQPDDPQAASITLARDGTVAAMVGGRNFAVSNVNSALGAVGGGSEREGGSLFKVITLIAALKKGIPPTKAYPAPSEIHIPLPDGTGTWDVSHGASPTGSYDLLEGLAQSSNTTYAQVARDTGAENIAALANQLLAVPNIGITPNVPPYLAVALGGTGTSPIEVGTAYNTVANGGAAVPTHFIKRITDAHGKILYDYKNKAAQQRIFDAGIAKIVAQAMVGVVTHGTASGAITAPTKVAAKTGTAEDYGNAWMGGFGCNATTVVWTGYPDQSRPMHNVEGVANVDGASLPGKIWDKINDQIKQEPDCDIFKP